MINVLICCSGIIGVFGMAAYKLAHNSMSMGEAAHKIAYLAVGWLALG